MNALAKLLGVGGSQSAATVPPTDARDRLRLALADRGPALAVIDEAVQARQRVRDLIAAAAEADEIATDAERQVADCTRAWALQGAKETGPAIPQAQLDAMAAAQRTAGELHFKAEGAKAALPAMADREQDARIALKQQDEQIRSHVTAVLLELHEPAMRELEEMHARSVELIAEVSALAVLLDPRFATWKDLVASTTAVRARLSALALNIPDERDGPTKVGADALARFARELLKNPDAEL